jgi:hypothetical protein
MRSTEPDQPLDPDDLPPELRSALAKMSERGPVVDMSTGTVFAQDGRMADEPPADLLACVECARAVSLGWWGSIARHCGDPGTPVCQLCSEGEATLTAKAWFALVQQMVIRNTASGIRRSWRDDSVQGMRR